MTTLNVNGIDVEVDCEADKPLLWVLREDLGLTGTKYACGIARCHACTVHLDGAAVPACRIPLEAAAGRRITTIEGLDADDHHPLQDTWVEASVPQCGYCQSGMIMAAAALLARSPQPSDAEIDAALNNLCRCGSYPRIRAAIHAAARRV